jgi:hypothetical protein
MLAANRANAKKPTGPVTDRGQAITRYNAAKHWGRVEIMRELLPALGERAEDFEEMRQRLVHLLPGRHGAPVRTQVAPLDDTGRDAAGWNGGRRMTKLRRRTRPGQRPRSLRALSHLCRHKRPPVRAPKRQMLDMSTLARAGALRNWPEGPIYHSPGQAAWVKDRSASHEP